MLQFLSKLFRRQKPLLILEYNARIDEGGALARQKADEIERRSGHPVTVIPLELMSVRCVLP